MTLQQFKREIPLIIDELQGASTTEIKLVLRYTAQEYGLVLKDFKLFII